MMGLESGDGSLSVYNRDRVIIVVAIIIITCVSWVYLFNLSGDMDSMSGFDSKTGLSRAMPNMVPWGFSDWISMFVMWFVMMIGMMVPTASPMILMFSTVNRQKKAQNQPYVATAVFLSGYVLVWLGFSIGATVSNWVLHSNTLLSGMMGESTSNLFGGVLLISAGIFQWTPIKKACLNNCRTPMGFLMTEWNNGSYGAFRMGLGHGIYCLGCCWLLMALLFVLGVMNLVWIAVLTALILVEKVAPKGDWVSRITGIGFAVWGIILLFQI